MEPDDGSMKPHALLSERNVRNFRTSPGKEHVIARRAQPDVAIPWIFCPAELGLPSVCGIATGLTALAMTCMFQAALFCPA